jgi:hypothetical protein
MTDGEKTYVGPIDYLLRVWWHIRQTDTWDPDRMIARNQILGAAMKRVWEAQRKERQK